jgi:hypothetical protein
MSAPGEKRRDAWSPEEEARLRELYPTTKSAGLASFFDRSPSAIRSRARVLRLQKAIGYGGKVAWTWKMDQLLRDQYPETLTHTLAAKLGVSVLASHQRAQRFGIRKSAAYLERQHQEGRRRLRIYGVAYRYPKGNAPPNKGIRRPGWAPGRMASTQFKKGQAPLNTMPMWSFRWCDGYLMLKTGADTPKPTTGWEYVHKLIWEQAHGPLPDWKIARLWWKDGDHANCALSNLELVAAAEHMRRTTVHNLPAPLPQVIQLAGALKRKIRNREEKLNGKEHVTGSAGSSVRDAGIAV